MLFLTLQHKIISHWQILSIVDRELQLFLCSENDMYNGQNITNQQEAHNNIEFNIIHGKQEMNYQQMSVF